MRGLSILEVLLVFFVWRVGFYVLQFYTGFSTYGLAQFILPVLIIAIARRSWGEYGFTTKNWQESTEIGLNAYLLALIPLGTMLFLPLLGLGYQDILGGALIGACYVCASVILLKLVTRRAQKHSEGMPLAPGNSPAPSRPTQGRNNLVVIACLLLLPILLAVTMGPSPPAQVGDVVYWDMWQFFVSGFGEETLYRGYCQSRLNAEFGRPYAYKGVHFGPGLFIAAALFGVTHVLNPFNPLTGTYTLAWGWGIMTFFGGIFFGLIREVTGDLIGPGIAHGLPDAVGESLSLVFTGTYP